SGFVGVYKNQGNGKFPTTPEYYELPGTVDYLLIYDLDGDNQLDIAVSSQNTNQVYVLYNQGQGTYLKTGIPGYPAGQTPGPMGIGDFVGDSKPDIIVGSIGVGLGAAVSCLQNLGQGFPPTPPPYISLNGAVINDVIVRDLDKDGKSDIIVDYV